MSTPAARASVEPLEIVRLGNSLGVLSVYVDADPREQASRRPAWVVAAENGLDEIRAHVKTDGDRERWTALVETLERLEPELAALLDPRQPGRGRALFAAIGGEEMRRVTVQMPLVDRVALDDRADVTPLLVALDRGRPAGLVVVSQTAVRVLESSLGAVEELTTIRVEPDASDWREMRGPAAANPALAQHSAAQRDRFERRVDDRRSRLLEGAALELERERAQRGWDRLVLAGDPRVTQPFVQALGTDHLDLVVVDRTLTGVTAAEVADALAPDLEQANARREARLVDRARDAALAGGAGALGLEEVLTALEDGRVEHLLFDPGRLYPGARAPDGRLVPEGVVPAGVAQDELVPAPSLVGHLVERALETDASITPLTAACVESLAEHDGLAACLRW